ncbi:hypothetical protein OB69_04425 [Roseivirga seohaensis subsp. aquiponti]|uniref:histidine kinase n=2 Tax=Roseivirga seohaensis TaxID=1914963 RepID=A0A0L8ANB3_9BACT|nr:hypothetical protein OB69_04425 [Roseivirga seohaensis subsp. aquiponti]
MFFLIVMGLLSLIQYELKGQEQTAALLLNEGVTFAKSKSYDSAIVKFNDALNFAVQQNDTANILKSYRNLGLSYRYVNQPLKSINTYLRGLELIGDNDAYSIIKGRFLNSLGSIYMATNSFEKAKASFLQAITQMPESNSYHIWLNNLGNANLELDDYDLAIQNFRESLALKRNLGLKEEERVVVYNNLGEALLRSDQLVEAKIFLDSALLFREADSAQDKVPIWNNLTWYYMKVGSSQQAERYLLLSSKVIDQSINKDKVKYYWLGKSLADVVGDYKGYVKYDMMHDSLNDLTFKESRLMLQEAQSEYEIDQRENQLNQQEELLAAQQTIITKNTNLLILVIIIALIVLGSAIYFVLLNSRNKKLRMRNELLVREQNHRVKNNLQMISSLLSLQAGKAQDEISKYALKQSQGRIQAIALLNRSLYDQEEIGDIDLKVYISELITEVINSITDTEVKYQLDIDDIKLDLEKTTSLGLIINELIVNSVKYVQQSVTEFSLSIKAQSGKFSLEYTDNGENFDLQAYQNSKSFGKKLVELQAKQLKGKSKISNDSQFRYQLNFS